MMSCSRASLNQYTLDCCMMWLKSSRLISMSPSLSNSSIMAFSSSSFNSSPSSFAILRKFYVAVSEARGGRPAAAAAAEAEAANAP